MEQLLELARERKLDRVGATYAVVAWIVVQAASIALPAFDAPAWALRWLIVAAMIGFPLILALAWLKASRAPATTAARPFEGKDWLLTGLIALVAVLLIVQLALDYSWRRVTPPSGAPSTTVVAASSIAVLPFANLSGDPKKVYFSDGIADQLITELAQTPSLRVAARSSSFAFRGKEVDVKTIAKALNVRAVLEGSVREDGKRVRIAAELVDAANGFQIWSQSYDRDLTNILGLQDDIAHAITEAVAQRFLGHAVVASRTQPKALMIDPEAYKAYLQGQYYFAQRTKEGVLRAIDLFTRTTVLAPKYADGFAALADAHATSTLDFQTAGGVRAALEAVGKALALDPDNPTAIMARATAELLQWRWRSAAADIRRLDQLHVSTAPAWHMRAIFFDYMGLTQFCGAAEERAIQLDPLSFIDHYNLALYRERQKRYEDAERIAAQAWALQPGNADLQQVNVQIALGNHDMKRAERILSALVAQTGENSPYAAAGRFFIFVAKKDFAAARKFADSVAKQFPASGITANDLGIAYAMANDMNTAIMWFRRSVNLHEPQFLPVEYTNPSPAKLYADPRWKALRAEPEVRDWENARREIEAEFQAGE
ncbi:MAG TPA: tetratricopeptide repeat protein [Rhizomicrobium sp.]|jgi:TolB-like protein|nr:tetratricopeptide repeat protein [Rhizomicrobium sp.]